MNKVIVSQKVLHNMYKRGVHPRFSIIDGKIIIENRLEAIEKRIFGYINIYDDIKHRLENIENKVFGQISIKMCIEQRIIDVEEYLAYKNVTMDSEYEETYKEVMNPKFEEIENYFLDFYSEIHKKEKECMIKDIEEEAWNQANFNPLDAEISDFISLEKW